MILPSVGAGGIGEVYKACDKRLTAGTRLVVRVYSVATRKVPMEVAG